MITIADWYEITRERNLVEFVDYNRIMGHEVMLILYQFKETVVSKVKKRFRSC